MLREGFGGMKAAISPGGSWTHPDMEQDAACYGAGDGSGVGGFCTLDCG